MMKQRGREDVDPPASSRKQPIQQRQAEEELKNYGWRFVKREFKPILRFANFLSLRYFYEVRVFPVE